MSEQNDPLVGTLVAGRYRVEKLLGEGGMGQVYLAVHEAIEKKVAIKVLRKEYSSKSDIVARFQQEAISASRIKHPNVLDVFDFGQLDDGCFFLAMEFLEGNDLADDLARTHVVEPLRGTRIALQITRALAAAHSRGVVHRDMKPENVFLQRIGDGEEIVKIVDFGIAQLRTAEEAAASEPKRRRLTRTGMIFGTPEYMAPEQAAGKKADLRVDIYATGVILYEMFTGAVPHTGDTFMAVLAAHLNDPTPPLTQTYPEVALSAQFQQVILACLAKNPDERYQSMSDLAAALLTTPEGQSLGTRGSMPDVPASQFIAAGASMLPPMQAHVPSPTAQQFAPGGAASSPTTAQFVPGAPPAPELGRVATQLGAETLAPPLKKSRAGLWVALIVLLGAGGAGAALLFRDGPSPAVDPARSATAPATTSAAPEPSAAPLATSAAPPASAEPPTADAKVRLHVVTDPPGAVVTKNGFQVCGATPCDVEANPDESLELEAKLDNKSGKVKVLAQQDQTVTIALKAPVVAGTAKPKPPGQRMCEVEVDGLKILRPCP
ncbi:MAG: serine/threonine-protein kinase [Sorangiineae bacterium]|nr:serine/threonine-protein kinase [Polyangiaceae bacterium]MEB2324923.1 serine/threonine-protein kinase [Sorangiineae bacterium]